MQIVYRAQDATEAHLVAGLLQAHDIYAFVGGHFLQGGLGDLGVFNTANVQVEEDDITEALIIIETYDKEKFEV